MARHRREPREVRQEAGLGRKADIARKAREQLQQTNPKLYAQLQKDNPDYDREIIKQVLPYIGVGYNQYPRELPQEQVGTVSMEQAEGDDDLPF